MVKLRHGLSKAPHSRNGRKQDRFYGFMVNVSLYCRLFLTTPDHHLLTNHVAGSGKSIFWYVLPHVVFTKRVHISNQLHHYSKRQGEMRSWTSPDGLLLLRF